MFRQTSAGLKLPFLESAGSAAVIARSQCGLQGRWEKLQIQRSTKLQLFH